MNEEHNRCSNLQRSVLIEEIYMVLPFLKADTLNIVNAKKAAVDVNRIALTARDHFNIKQLHLTDVKACYIGESGTLFKYLVAVSFSQINYGRIFFSLFLTVMPTIFLMIFIFYTVPLKLAVYQQESCNAILDSPSIQPFEHLYKREKSHIKPFLFFIALPLGKG